MAVMKHTVGEQNLHLGNPGMIISPVNTDQQRFLMGCHTYGLFFWAVPLVPFNDLGKFPFGERRKPTSTTSLTDAVYRGIL